MNATTRTLLLDDKLLELQEESKTDPYQVQEILDTLLDAYKNPEDRSKILDKTLSVLPAIAKKMPKIAKWMIQDLLDAYKNPEDRPKVLDRMLNVLPTMIENDLYEANWMIADFLNDPSITSKQLMNILDGVWDVHSAWMDDDNVVNSVTVAAFHIASQIPENAVCDLEGQIIGYLSPEGTRSAFAVSDVSLTGGHHSLVIFEPTQDKVRIIAQWFDGTNDELLQKASEEERTNCSTTPAHYKKISTILVPAFLKQQMA